MSGLLTENRIGLGLGEVGEPRRFRDASHRVAGAGVEWLHHLVRGNRHLGEELDAVGASALLQPHDAVVEAIGSLAWSQLRDIGSPDHRLGRTDFVEVGRRSAEALRGDEGDERNQRDRRDDPRKGGGSGIRYLPGGSSNRGTAAMAKASSGRECRCARSAGRALERRSTIAAKTTFNWCPARRTGCGDWHGGNVRGEGAGKRRWRSAGGALEKRWHSQYTVVPSAFPAPLPALLPRPRLDVRSPTPTFSGCWLQTDGRAPTWSDVVGRIPRVRKRPRG